jgi:DNA-binding MarR family transcriptional regulator
MNKEKASIEIMELFMRVVNKYNALEKIPVRHSLKHDLFHSERHMLDKIADNPDMNITDLAQDTGVTKGAISQIVKKLETKGLVRRYKRGTNDKEVFIELTRAGMDICKKRRKLNKENIMPLCDELKRHTNDEVNFLVSMFHWFDEFMDQSAMKMKSTAHIKS